MLTYLLLSLAFATFSISATDYGPPDVLPPNACGIVAPNRKVHIEVVLYNYCLQPSSHPNADTIIKDYLECLRRDIGSELFWTITFSIRTTLCAAACNFPAYSETADPDAQIILFNIVFKPILIFLALPGPIAGFIKAEKQNLNAASLTSVCLGDANYCNEVYRNIDSSYAPSDWNSATFLDVQYGWFRIDQLEELSSIRWHDMQTSFYCNPKYIGASPVIEITDSGDVLCTCHCCEDSEFSFDANYNKVCTPKPVKGECDWLNKCYAVDITSDPTPSNYLDKCELNLFATSALSGLPCPWDNYVFNKLNAQGVNIEISLTSPPILNAQPVVTTKTFTWDEYSGDNRKVLLSDNFKFSKAGIYTLSHTARDYHGETTCTTEIYVNDNYRPNVDTEYQCQPQPTLNPKNKWETFKDGYSTLGPDFIDRVRNHKNNPVNDLCGSQQSCDIDKRAVRNLGESFSNLELTQANVVTTPISFDLNQADRDYMHTISTTITADTPGTRQLKCWKVKLQFGEPVIEHICDEAPIEHTCLRGDSCKFLHCLWAVGHQFYKAPIQVHVNEIPRTKEVVDALSQGEPSGFDELCDIHYAVEETTIGSGPDQGNQELHLSDVIQIGFDSKALAADTEYDNYGTNNDIHSFVKCKYFLKGTWYIWDPAPGKNTHTFDTPETNIDIQCWTRIGKISEKTITVWLHPHAELDICGEFSQKAFFQSLCPDHTKPGHYCNYPGSDFAEFGIKFYDDLGRSPGNLFQQIPYDFQSITCTAYYINPSIPATPDNQLSIRIGDGYEIVSETGADLHFVDHFSAQLANPTAETTALEITCVLNYLSKTDVQVQQVCPTYLYFEDCDKPEFGREVCECETDCTPTEIKPYQACGGKRLSLEKNANDNFITAFKQTYNDACCTACSADTKCVDIGPDLINGEPVLQRCEFPTAVWVPLLLRQYIDTYPTLIPGLFLVVGVVGAVIVRKLRKTSANTIESSEYYTPLI